MLLTKFLHHARESSFARLGGRWRAFLMELATCVDSVAVTETGFSGAGAGDAIKGFFEPSSSPRSRRSGRLRGSRHELFSSEAKVLAREKPVARECSKKRKPRKSARTISHYMYWYLSKKVGSPLVERERGGGTGDTCCRRVLEGGDRSQ